MQAQRGCAVHTKRNHLGSPGKCAFRAYKDYLPGNASYPCVSVGSNSHNWHKHKLANGNYTDSNGAGFACWQMKSITRSSG